MSFKSFVIDLLNEEHDNAHSEKTLNDAFEKAWSRHGSGIISAIATQPVGLHSHPLQKYYAKHQKDTYQALIDDKTVEAGPPKYHRDTTWGGQQWRASDVKADVAIKEDFREHMHNMVRRDYPKAEVLPPDDENGPHDEYDLPALPELQPKPDYQPVDKAIPGSHPKYMDVALKWAKEGMIPDPRDFESNIRENFQKYDHLKRNKLLRTDIANNLDNMDASRLPPPHRNREGQYQYDSHASFDHNKFISAGSLFDFVTHPAYKEYFQGPSHEEAMAKLKEGVDYDVVHDSTPGGKDRSKLSPDFQQAKMGVKVFHAKTEAAAHALAIVPGTRDRCEWCTAVPGHRGGNEQFKWYNAQGPILIYHGEKDSLKDVDGRPPLRQVHVTSGEWMDEHNKHDDYLNNSKGHRFPSFGGFEAAESSRSIVARNFQNYDFRNSGQSHARFNKNQYSDFGVELQEDWHLHKRFGDSHENRERSKFGSEKNGQEIDYNQVNRSNLAEKPHGIDQLISINRRIAPFANFTKEQEDNMDAIFKPSMAENRYHLIERTQNSKNPISHTTKKYIAMYGSEDDVSHLTSNFPHPRTGKWTTKPRHDFDDDTIKALMSRDLNNGPKELRSMGRVYTRYEEHPVIKKLAWDSSFTDRLKAMNDLPINPSRKQDVE